MKLGGLMIQVHDLQKHFGGFRAVDGASLTIETGSITGLIGPNGAGKSTLFNVIAGVFKPTSGRVMMAGEDITGLPPHELFRKGLLRTFQLAHEFSSMTVRENLMMVPAGQSGETLINTWFRRRRIREEERALRKKADEVLEFLTISHLAEEKAGNLSGGQKKLLELGRTMMVDAKIVFLDEVGAGVNRTLLGTIGDAIVRLNKERGYTFCVIEHDMDFIGRLCDPVIVMAAGKVLAEGSADSIMKNEAVIEAYLGTGLKNKVAAEVAEEAAFAESHGAQPGLGSEAGHGGDGKPEGGL
ncbi:ABC transporter ATP-binding protein [Paracoccus kondratievae]|uniref:ABC transporter ATP-binding protein n=2 Tax=Paracoccus kondratievae TaxID=135740 RepID=A0AAD3RVI5_9RHOB|nr:ABC transporter ATP-binding protein [Paracoccus kondratievae]